MIRLSDLLTGYSALSTRDRLHMTIRWRVCPMRRIASYVPERGVIVDLGCGHGLFTQLMAREAQDRTVIGVDLDEHKVALAKTLCVPNLRFEVGDLAAVELPPVDALIILDVFYLVPYAVQEALLRACARRLGHGGVILLKDMAEVPRWKVALNWLEETLAVRVLRITLGGEFYFRSRAGWTRLFESLGFSVEVIPLDRGYYHPHVLLVARKA
ncbi:MAG TPA: class I SAM-dependent methyltransferase [Aggregatilineales bacterium]|nr:class I SAM-dependent methyltransferase [Aggregatilineales bacterium]